MDKDKNFDEKMTKIILPKFASDKKWEDTMKSLDYLKSNLNKEKYSDFNLSNLTNKVQLARHLSNSLKIEIPPGTHEFALSVYSDIFSNIRKHNNDKLGEDMGIYLSGLFPFFNYASSPNKSNFLEKIVKKHLLAISSNELESILPGLISCLLPGLEDNSQGILKELKDIFLKIRFKLSDSKFFGSLWMILLRTERLRLVGVKYLCESIPNYSTIQKSKFSLSEEENFINFFFPSKDILIINSIKAMIEDKDTLVQRSIMDFLIDKLPINNGVLSSDSKIALIESVLILLVKNEHSLTRRLFQWLLNSIEEDPEMGDPVIQMMVELLVKAFNLIFKDGKTKFGISALHLLFIYQANFIDYVLPEVTWQMILSIYHNRKDVEIIATAKKFYEYDVYYLDTLWKTLNKVSNPFTYYQSGLLLFHKKMTNQLEVQSQMLRSSHYFKNVDENVENLIEDDDIEKDFYDEEKKTLSLIMEIFPYVIQFSTQLFPMKALELKYIFYLPIISNMLFEIATSKINSIDDLINLKSILGSTLNIVIDMYYEEEKSTINILKGIAVNRFSKVADNIKNDLKKNVLLYEKFYINVLNFILINPHIDDNKLKLFQNSTELVVKLQIYKELDHMPEWLVFIIKLIFTTDNVIVALEALEFILDILNMKNENDSIREIKLFLRQESLEYILTYSYELIMKSNRKSIEFNSSNIIDGILGKFNESRSSNPLQRSRNSLEFAMCKLWKLLYDQSLQKKITDILVKFSRSDPDLFTNAISTTLNSTDLEELVDGINTFSQFWKLTNELYPNYKFFEKGEITFKILDFLNHPHPLIRHVAKSWLSTTVDQFDKVLDPLLFVLIHSETKFYHSPLEDILVFTDVYDSKRIIDALHKLKKIMIEFSDYDKIVRYCVKTKPNPKLIEACEQGDNSDSLKYLLDSYLDILVYICMRFIKGVFIQSVNLEFHKEHYSVKAATCEFLEFFLNAVEDKGKIFNIANKISDPILSILKEYIINDEVVLQVQILNLLKPLLIATEPAYSMYPNISRRIFNSKVLHDCLNLGISHKYVFVRTHFISFLESCFIPFKNLLSIEDNIMIVKRLLLTSSEFLNYRVEYFKSLNRKKILKTSKKFIPFSILENTVNDYQIKENFSSNEDSKSFFVFKNYLPEYSEIISFDESDIITILLLVNKILINFLDIKVKATSHNDINWSSVEEILNKCIEEKRSKSNTSTTGYLMNFIVETTKTITDIINNPEEIKPDIKIEIFKIYDKVFKNFLKCWISHSGNYMTKDMCLTTNGIVTLNENSNVNFSDQSLIGINLNMKHLYQTYKETRRMILNININVLSVSPKELFTVLLGIWTDDEFHKSNQFNKLLFIELLTETNVPMKVFIKCILSNIDPNQVAFSVKSKIKLNGIYPYILSYSNSVFESKLCQLIYSFIAFSKYFDPCWEEFLEFFNIMSNSKCPTTWIWLFDIFNSLLAKSPVVRDLKFKLRAIFENISEKLSKYALLGNIDFVYDIQGEVIKPMSPLLYEEIIKEVYKTNPFTVNIKKNSTANHQEILSFLDEDNNSKTPNFKDLEDDENNSLDGDTDNNNFIDDLKVSIEKRESSLDTKDKNHDQNELEQEKRIKINKEHHLYIKPGDDNTSPLTQFYFGVFDSVSNNIVLKNEDFTKLYRISAFLNLKLQYYSIIRQINPADKQEKAILHMQDIIKDILTVLNKRAGIDEIYLDLAIEFLDGLYSKANLSLANTVNTSILQYFFDFNFFRTSKKSLKHWMHIMQNYIRFYPSFLDELMKTLDYNNGTFIPKKEDPIKVKIEVLRRISFIIYSCPKDSFDLKKCLIKIKDILISKDNEINSDYVLSSEVFLLIRIMFLKFSNKLLIETLDKIWPIVFTEIVNILLCKKKEINLDSTLSCLKLIECLSLANPDVFCLYEWMMLYDCK